MAAFRAFLAIMFTVIAIYTVIVIADEGLGLLPIFFGDIGDVEWPGQFNLDFLGMLLLSGFWVAWRHEFSPAGLVLGLGAALLGAPFLCVYLLVMTQRSNGDVTELLLGPTRAGALAG